MYVFVIHALSLFPGWWCRSFSPLTGSVFSGRSVLEIFQLDKLESNYTFGYFHVKILQSDYMIIRKYYCYVLKIWNYLYVNIWSIIWPSHHYLAVLCMGWEECNLGGEKKIGYGILYTSSTRWGTIYLSYTHIRNVICIWN